VPTSSLSSHYKARQIAQTLKSWISKGDFPIREPVQAFPKERTLKVLDVCTEREVG
jgi:uncharacterized protein (DUF39 family)